MACKAPAPKRSSKKMWVAKDEEQKEFDEPCGPSYSRLFLLEFFDRESKDEPTYVLKAMPTGDDPPEKPTASRRSLQAQMRLQRAARSTAPSKEEVTGAEPRERSASRVDDAALKSSVTPGILPAAFGMMPPVVFAKQPISLLNVSSNNGKGTMLTLGNIPPLLSPPALIEGLNSKNLKGSYDFLYLPGNRNRVGNRGWAFINFRQQKKAKQFTKQFHQAKAGDVLPVGGQKDTKLCEVKPVSVQFVTRQLETFRDGAAYSAFTESMEWQPLLFDENGDVGLFPLFAPFPFSSIGELPPVPDKAVDARALEKKMEEKPVSRVAHAAAREAEMYSRVAQDYAAAQAERAAVHHAAQAAAAAAAALAHGVSPDVGSEGQPGKVVDEETLGKLRKQFEFYFSRENLVKDVYLRKHMDANGWISLQLLANFPMVRKLGVVMQDIANVLDDSGFLEVDAARTSVRLKDEEQRKSWTRPSEGQDGPKSEGLATSETEV